MASKIFVLAVISQCYTSSLQGIPPSIRRIIKSAKNQTLYDRNQSTFVMDMHIVVGSILMGLYFDYICIYNTLATRGILMARVEGLGCCFIIYEPSPIPH